MATIIRITKAVLADQLAVAIARISQLEVQLVAERSAAVTEQQRQRALYERANARHQVLMRADVPEAKPAKPEQRARILYEMPQWQVDRAASMSAARNLAMDSRSMVKVGA